MKVAIHSVPRSGSTWLGSIFDSHSEVLYKFQPLFSYAFKEALTVDSTKEEIENFFNELANSKDDFLDQSEAKLKGIVPEFEKRGPSCIVYKEVRYHYIIETLLKEHDSVKVVGLVRNPLSVISSWLNAPKEFRKDLGWSVEDEWKNAPKKNLGKDEEFNGYEKWKEVALIFHELKTKFPNRFYLLEYSQLLKRPIESVEKLFEFTGLEMQKSTIDFLLNSTGKSTDDAYGVYKEKSKDNQWENNLPQNIISYIIRDLKNTNLEQYIYD